MTLGTQNDSKRSKLLVQCFLGHPWAVWRGTILVAYEYDLGRYHLIDAYQSVVTTLLGVVSVQYDWGWKASTGCPGKNTHMYTFIINVHTYECTCHVIYILYYIIWYTIYICIYIYGSLSFTSSVFVTMQIGGATHSSHYMTLLIGKEDSAHIK